MQFVIDLSLAEYHQLQLGLLGQISFHQRAAELEFNTFMDMTEANLLASNEAFNKMQAAYLARLAMDRATQP